MRDKEAMDLERKNAARSIEKQAKVIERLVETERSLSAQVVSQPIVDLVDARIDVRKSSSGRFGEGNNRSQD
jgi:hypothetical protein